MRFYARGFNLYLLAALLLTGCAGHDKDKKGFLGTFRVHVESRGNLPDGGKKVKVLRAEPVEVTIDTESILSEANIVSVMMIEARGGFALKVKFDETGSWALEQYSAANPGRHFVIFAQWDKNPEDGRWLAAPLITHRIGDGVLSFTPDCSREEAQKLVASVNRAAKKIQTGTLSK
jgi:hypothetical protein